MYRISIGSVSYTHLDVYKRQIQTFQKTTKDEKFFIYHLFDIIKAMKTATIIDLIVDSDVHTQSMNHIIKQQHISQRMRRRLRRCV